jgi:DNA-binding response OmpR family regulator
VAQIMTKSRILIVEDDDHLAGSIQRTLLKNLNCTCVVVMGLNLARNVLEDRNFDLIILDRLLPDGDGLSLLRGEGVREGTKVFVLSGLGRVQDREKGFLAGVFDYLVKPFSQVEFLQRVQRIIPEAKKVVRVIRPIGKNVVFIPNESKLVIEGKETELTMTDCQLMECLYRNKNCMVSRDELRRDVWGNESDLSENAINAKIYRLRQKMGDYGCHLRTYYKLGYQLKTTKAAK